MQVVILAGGTGTRLKEMTEFLPKPLIPIGGRPFIWHIMNWYSSFGHTDFILSLGYKQEKFKSYFMHLDAFNSDITVYRNKGIEPEAVYHDPLGPGWKITLADTGPDTLKGARLARVKKYIKTSSFMVTYGDGIADINIRALLTYHNSHSGIGTLTGVHPVARFGEIVHKKGRITAFAEKPLDTRNLMNGGFMVFNQQIFNYLNTNKTCDLEVGPLEMLAKDDGLYVYQHKGFWKNMDTLKDVGELQNLWESGEAPWSTERNER